MEKVSLFIQDYEYGLRDTRAELYFKRAQFLNQNKKAGSADIDTDDYKTAISLWGESTKRNFYIAKKMISQNDSDIIKWMDKLGESSEIFNEYGKRTDYENFTEEALGIVFTHLLSKDFMSALNYPYPKDDYMRWNRLYANDKVRFLYYSVLEKYSYDKYTFLESICKNISIDETVFADKISDTIFDKIFGLDEEQNGDAPWILFTCNLKDIEGKRVIKYADNRLNLLKALSKKIEEEKFDVKICSCFIDMLFDKNYNYHQAKNFQKTLTYVFGKGVFNRNDFNDKASANRYFRDNALLSEDEINTIKDNIREYVTRFCNEKKKSEADVKSMLRAYDTVPDFRKGSLSETLSEWYKGLLKNKNMDDFKPLIKERLAYLTFVNSKSKGEKNIFKEYADALKELNLTISSATDNYNKEDSALFILNCSKNGWKENTLLLCAKLIYVHRIRRDDLRSQGYAKDTIDNICDKAKDAISAILNEDNINISLLQLYSYLWEAFLGTDDVIANYEWLMEQNTLPRPMMRYCKKRSLHKASFVPNGDKLKEKQQKYGMLYEGEADIPLIKLEDISFDFEDSDVNLQKFNLQNAAEQLSQEKEIVKVQSKRRPRISKEKADTINVDDTVKVDNIADTERANTIKFVGDALKMGMTPELLFQQEKIRSVLTLDEISEIAKSIK